MYLLTMLTFGSIKNVNARNRAAAAGTVKAMIFAFFLFFGFTDDSFCSISALSRDVGSEIFSLSTFSLI